MATLPKLDGYPNYPEAAIARFNGIAIGLLHLLAVHFRQNCNRACGEGLASVDRIDKKCKAFLEVFVIGLDHFRSAFY